MGKHNIWMSVSDLMTGLMVIFLFIAIAYMKQVNKYLEKLKENQTVLTEYVENRNKLHDKLNSEFKNAPKEWQLVIGKDLSMKFENPEVLFASSSSNLTPQFKSILDEFIPRYIDILVNDTLRYSIKEIRIEGHTDDDPFANGGDPFLDNAKLSQARALEVLEYIRKMPAYQNYSDEQKKQLEYWFTDHLLTANISTFEISNIFKEYYHLFSNAYRAIEMSGELKNIFTPNGKRQYAPEFSFIFDSRI